MQEYIFYTPEGCCKSPNNQDIENFQVLGTEAGKSTADALERLIMNNPWIVESGYNTEEIIIRALA